MGIHPVNGSAGSGNGREHSGWDPLWASIQGKLLEFTEGECRDVGTSNETIERLVSVMVKEAVNRQASEILVGLDGDECRIHFVCGEEKLQMDSVPIWLFNKLRQCVARMCGGNETEAHGSFALSLTKTETSSKPYAEVKVLVTRTDSGLRLTIIQVNHSE